MSSLRFYTCKLDNQAAWDYLMLLIDKLIGHMIPIRFIAFALVGVFGVFVHLLTLSLMVKGLRMGFVTSQSVPSALRQRLFLGTRHAACRPRLPAQRRRRGDEKGFWKAYTSIDG